MTRYYLGPWIWRESADDGSYWDAPVGTVGRIDLRPLPCNIPGYGFFALESPPMEAGYVELADSLTKPLSLAAKTALIDALKLPSLDATNLADALAEILTTKADPTGAVRCLPLIPKLDGTLEIIVASEVVWERQFEGESDEAWPNIQKVLQANYHKIREQALADGTAIRNVTLGAMPGIEDAAGYRRYLSIQMVVQGGPRLLNPDWTPEDWHVEQEKQAAYAEGTHRRYLDALNAKYAISAEKFIPDDLPVETVLPRATIITESFNKANNGLGPDLSWTNVDGVWGVTDNEADMRTTGGSARSARAESDLSSDDHYAQIDVTALGSGANGALRGSACRFAAAAETLYTAFLYQLNDNIYLQKYIDGVETNLDNHAVALSIPDTVKVQADGTTIKAFFNAGEEISLTDPSISGNLRCGLTGYSDGDYNARQDNFEAADLAPSFIPYPYPRGLRGGHSVQTGGLV